MVDWTEERVERLKALWAQDAPVLSATQIAESLGHGVTKNAVMGKVYRLGLPLRPSLIKRSAGTPRARNQEPPQRAPRATLAPLPSLAVVPVPPVRALPPVRKTTTLCVYPIGEPRKPGFRFCEAPVERVGRSYCDYHHAVCWRMPTRTQEVMILNIKRTDLGLRIASACSPAHTE
jgi:GcrA cell cycle regulator